MKTISLLVAAAVALLCTAAESPPRLQSTPGVSLIWNPNPESDLAGYRIWYDLDSNTTNSFSVGNVTHVSVLNLISNATYFFSASAYNFGGLESDKCDPISCQLDRLYVLDAFNPEFTLKFDAFGVGYGTGNIVRFTWPENTNAAGYYVEYGIGSDTNGPLRAVDTGKLMYLAILGVIPGSNYWGRPVAYDAQGHEARLYATNVLITPEEHFLRVVYEGSWITARPSPVRSLSVR